MKTDKEKIDELIEYERSYNWFQLFISWPFIFYGTYAHKQSSYYKLWIRDYWAGPFFAVFTISFDSEGMVTKIDVEKSPTAKYFNAFFSIFLGTMLILTFTHTTLEIVLNKPLFFLLLIALTVTIFIVGSSLTMKIYLNETRFQLEDLKIALGRESEISNAQNLNNSKERTPVNLFLRILIYPLLLTAITFSLYHAQEFPKGLFLTFICGTYLIADLILLFRK